MEHRTPSIIPHQLLPARAVSPLQQLEPHMKKIDLPPYPPDEVVTKPSCPEPIAPPYTSFKHITTHYEANAAAQHAIQARIKDLPNVGARKHTVGKSNSNRFTNGLMQPRGATVKHHPAHQLLSGYAKHGCPVDCGPNWSREQLEEALRYGAHPSARQGDALACLIQEAREKEKEGFVKIISWGSIKNKIPKKLKLSPIAMIPHKSRKFRAILDLSFHLRSSATTTMTAKSVNEATTILSNRDAMNELGNALQRILARLADAKQQNRKLWFAKLDIKDGFWRMIVSDDDAWNFCYAIPPADPATDLDSINIVVPNSLQMGWTESPPFFCAATETARDVIQTLLRTKLPPHKFEKNMLPPNFSADMQNTADLGHVVNLIEVFVDDFIGCTDKATEEHLLQFSRAMLHGIHEIFPPPSVTGHAGGDPVSEKNWRNWKDSGTTLKKSSAGSLTARTSLSPSRSKRSKRSNLALNKSCGGKR